MIKKILIGMFIVFVSPIYGEPVDEHADDRAQLRQLQALYERAVRENNLDLLKPHLAGDASIILLTDSESTNFDVFKKQWNATREKMLQGGSFDVKLNPEPSKIIDNVAIARGNAANIMIKGDGEKFQFNTRWTVVLQKIDGRWLIHRVHTSLNPFDNPMLKAGVKDLMTSVIAISLLAGVLLSALLMWLFGRMRRRPS